jgi:hypothetical protein
MAIIRPNRSVHVHEKTGTLVTRGGLASEEEPIQVEVNVMRKFLTALVAVASLSAAALAISSPAEARWGGGWGGGWRGGYWGPGAGFVAGALIGGAIAAGPYGYYGGGYPYGYGYYPYAYPGYGPGCVWRRVWNGYGWVRACV